MAVALWHEPAPQLIWSHGDVAHCDAHAQHLLQLELHLTSTEAGGTVPPPPSPPPLPRGMLLGNSGQFTPGCSCEYWQSLMHFARKRLLICRITGYCRWAGIESEDLLKPLAQERMNQHGSETCLAPDLRDLGLQVVRVLHQSGELACLQFGKRLRCGR